ncbi:hypothetical protein AX15_000160 [Amanita polypyramis BW_CC]|nr:hypothetical protein AX15_000160 [Amanita polypyramis BW_CC]
MWPHINLEDLLKPKLLLIFLNARGRHPPSAFSGVDANSVKFGMVTEKLIPVFLNNYTMMLTGRNTPETCGELIAWDDNDEALSWLTSQRVQPEPPTLSTSETGLNSLATVAAEAPYRLPTSLDLSRILDIIAAKCSAAEDHIWTLREDPSYFSDIMLDAKEHRLEVLPDMRGNRHPTLRPQAGGVFWNRVLGNTIADAYFSLVIWDELHRQIVNLQSLKTKYDNDIMPEKDLPEELPGAFLKLDYYLEQLTKGPIGNLKSSVEASPPLRAFFIREPQDLRTTTIQVKKRQTLVADKNIDHLLWIFGTMWDDRRLHLGGLHTLMDEMDRLIQSDSKLKELIPPFVASIISDLSVMSECRHQILLYQSWAAAPEYALLGRLDCIKAEHEHTVKDWLQFLKSFEGTSLGHLGTPSDGRSFYPVKKRRTRESTEPMCRAENSLDEFWEKVNKFLVNKAGMPYHQAIRHLLSDNRMLRRIPEWIEKPDAQRPDVQTYSPEYRRN